MPYKTSVLQTLTWVNLSMPLDFCGILFQCTCHFIKILICVPHIILPYIMVRTFVKNSYTCLMA